MAGQRRSLRKALRIGLLIFLLLVVGVALLSWWMGSPLLPMEYEGFN